VDFLYGLENCPGTIVVRHATIRRGLPDLDVDLILFAYRRQT
jgi:hypothetical protein